MQDINVKTTNGGKSKRTEFKRKNNTKTNIIVKEHFIGTKTFEEKLLNIMIRKIENEQK